MKKMKVTKRPKSNEFILKPAPVRMVLIYTVLFVVAIALGFFVRFIFNGFRLDIQRLLVDWPVNVAIVIGGSILLALLDYRRWTIRILGGEQVEGPSGAFGERLALPIREIDWTRTLRSLQSRFKIGNGIYATRQRILISPWFYNPDQYRQFLTTIGYDKALNA